jgi:putative aldouronate transport system substrate-binding protein
VNGKVVYDPKKFNKPMDQIQGVGKMAFTKNTPSVDTAGKSFYDVLHGVKPDTGVLMAAAAADQTMKEGFAISYENRDVLIPNAFNGPPTKTMQSSWAQLLTMESETYTKIIYGKEPVSAFDDFVKQWNERGGTQITEEVNEWYKNAGKTDVMSEMGLK